VSATPDLGRLERIIDASGVSERIEALLPVGVRPRQLRVRTLLIGMLLTLSDKRPAHLARVHEALIGLPGADRRRLGVIASLNRGGRIRTGDLTDPNGARYQASPRPGRDLQVYCHSIDRQSRPAVAPIDPCC
jgi:hypothetical protein